MASVKLNWKAWIPIVGMNWFDSEARDKIIILYVYYQFYCLMSLGLLIVKITDLGL